MLTNKRVFRSAMTAAIAGGSLGLTAFANAQNGLHFYQIGESQLSIEAAQELGKNFNLSQKRDPTGAPLPVWVAGDGSVRLSLVAGVLYLSPDLRRQKSPAPPKGRAKPLADEFAKKFGLFPDDRSTWVLGNLNFMTKQESDEKGNESEALTPLIGVRYQRKLDSLPVFGPTSGLLVNINANGPVGAFASGRPAQLLDTKVVPKSQEQIDREFENALDTQKELNPGDAILVQKVKCYWEEGRKFIQPVWKYDVRFSDADGLENAVEIVIPIAKNAPEPLQNPNYTGFQPGAPIDRGEGGGGGGDVYSIKLGSYVVRQDSDPGICLNVVNAFYNNSAAIAPLVGHNVNRTQYYWNYPWLWNDALGISDQARYYPGAVNMATVVAHASPWRFSCRGTGSEIVELANMNHFGANTPSGNPDQCYTSYMLFAACSFIPAPGDPHGGSWTSGSAFGVWWNMFWGMHAVYGFRTTAGKQACVDAFGFFGLLTGLGHANAGAWLDVTAGLGHGSNWNYGNVVMMTGYENDNIYNINARPKANSLTMWWNHS